MSNILKKTRIKVVPSTHTTADYGFLFVIYERSWVPFLWKETGRLQTHDQLKGFAQMHGIYDGRALDQVL